MMPKADKQDEEGVEKLRNELEIYAQNREYHD